jgi:hypothetical protein
MDWAGLGVGPDAVQVQDHNAEAGGVVDDLPVWRLVSVQSILL